MALLLRAFQREILYFCTCLHLSDVIFFIFYRFIFLQNDELLKHALMSKTNCPSYLVSLVWKRVHKVLFASFKTQTYLLSV